MTEDKEQYYEVLRRDYEEQAEYIRQLRSLKHDMQAHLLVLQYYLDAKRYEDAGNYLQELREHLESVKRPQVDTGNGMVDAIIMERWRQSKADICVFCIGEFPKKMISEYDLCTIVSNLFSNAVEACEKLNTLEKEIQVEIEEKKDGWALCIKNPVEWEVNREILCNGSTKENRELHGFGLRNVVHIVEKYEGRVDFLQYGNCFSVRVTILYP